MTIIVWNNGDNVYFLNASDFTFCSSHSLRQRRESKLGNDAVIFLLFVQITQLKYVDTLVDKNGKMIRIWDSLQYSLSTICPRGTEATTNSAQAVPELNQSM
jgi:hypothetical protein